MIQYPETLRFLSLTRLTGCPVSAGHDKRNLCVYPCDRVGKVARGERREVIDALADADKVHRQFVFLRQRHQDAAARGAVQFCHHETADASGTMKCLDLRERV